MITLLLAISLAFAQTQADNVFTPPERIKGVGIDRLSMDWQELEQSTEELKKDLWFGLLRDPKCLDAPFVILEPMIQEATLKAAQRIQDALLETGTDPSEQIAWTTERIQKLVNALMFVESYGNPLARSGSGARGIAQFTLAGALEVGLAKRDKKTKRVVSDERFNALKSVEALGKRVASRIRILGRVDLAIAEYHMGLGNMNKLVSLYTDTPIPRRRALLPDIGQVVHKHGLTYPRLYFTATPVNHPATWRHLESLADSSSTYLFRVLAAMDVLEMYKQDPAAYLRAVQNFRNRFDVDKKADNRMWVWYSPENVKTLQLQNIHDLKTAWIIRRVVPAPNRPELFGFRLRTTGHPINSPLAQHAPKNEKQWYYGSEKATVGALIYVAFETHMLMEARFKPLETTSLVRDLEYQAKLPKGRNGNGNAKTELPTHVIGKAFDMPMRNMSALLRDSLLVVLRDLQRKQMLTYIREGGSQITMHVVVHPDPQVRAFFERIYDAAVEFEIAQ